MNPRVVPMAGRRQCLAVVRELQHQFREFIPELQEDPMFKKTFDQTGKQALGLLKKVSPSCASSSRGLSVSSAGAMVVGLSTGVLAYLASKACAAHGGCFEDQVHDRYGRSLATPDMNVVDTSSEDSFPASDPPSFNAPSATPTHHE